MKKSNLSQFRAPPTIAAQATKGLLLRKQNKGKGGTAIGVARARDLKNRKPLAIGTLKRMASYFARHEIDKRTVNFGNDDKPSKGYIAWLLWGGDPGKQWVEKLLKQI